MQFFFVEKYGKIAEKNGINIYKMAKKYNDSSDDPLNTFL